MKKKNLWLSAAATLLMALSLGSCSPKAELSEGTYTGTAMAISGPLTVTIDVSNNRITRADVEQAGEDMPAITGALEALEQQILKEGRIDGVTGATSSSDAAREAFRQARGKAEGTIDNTGLKDGKYVTRVMGHEDYINVATLFREGKIAGCRVISHGETVGIGTYAAARIPAAIVEAQSLDVDSVTGATLTSGAIKQAVSQAVILAGGNLKDFQKPLPEAARSDEVVRRHADVVIAGAGTAGLMAGARLTDMGREVLLFEKAAIPGGAMPMTYGGVQSVGTTVGEERGQGREEKDYNWSRTLLENVYRSMVRPDFAPEEGDLMQYKATALEYSGRVVDWMRNIGIGFQPMGRYEGGLQLGLQPYFSPGVYQGGAGYAAMDLADRITVGGNEIVYTTPVTGLIFDDSHNVAGVIAEGRDGKKWKVTADAVLLATGGFAYNKDMLGEYYPEYKDFRFNGVSGNTGEGIAMGLEAGAGTECFDRDLGAYPAAYGSKFEVAFITMTVPGFIVNGKGDILAHTNHVELGNARLDRENEDRFYYIFDDEGVEAMKKSMNYGLSYASVFERDEVDHFNSLADAESMLKLPNLSESLASNNEGAAAGKRGVNYIETRDGIYVLRIEPQYYITTGGLKIDTQARVLTPEDGVIPRLYAAGDVAGSIEEKDGLLYGYGFPSALIYGYIAAETIDENL